MRLTVVGKLFVSLFVTAGSAAGLALAPELREAVAPGKRVATAIVPLKADLGDAPKASSPGCADLPEVRLYLWAWNAQQGLIFANGGPSATADSLMCAHNVNLKLIREDNVDVMQAAMVAFAGALQTGDPNPSAGAHMVAIMGDGSASFLAGLDKALGDVGPEQTAVVFGSAGYSRGEDKFMGPPSWKANPESARGGVVAGYLRDGDWNIAMKWLGDNGIPNNPDDTRYDPNALNWIAASDYIDAAQKYVTGYCTDLLNIETQRREKRCVDGVVTWTPGDVMVAKERGGLVSIVSTKEYRSQMPNVLIGNGRWLSENREIVTGLLSALFEGGEKVKTSEDARRQAAALSAVVYGEEDADYWFRYFTVQREIDKQGLEVELGGSSVNNLADNLQLFGLAPGSADLFAATYTVFGDIAKQQYPTLLPSYPPVDRIVDTSFIEAVASSSLQAGEADLARFAPDSEVVEIISRRAWSIPFESGRATFRPEAQGELEDLFDALVVASGTLVEIHGHTDNQGSIGRNQELSEDRAFAVKRWLEEKSSANFPEGRVRIFAHGVTQPLAPNDSPQGRAKNRRVEVVLGAR